MGLRDRHDGSGAELATIREKTLAIPDTMVIELHGDEIKVRKRAFGVRDRFIAEVDDGETHTAKGDFVDHEYEIERDGETVAEISKKWFRLRDTDGVEVIGEQDVPLILAFTVCIDTMARNRSN